MDIFVVIAIMVVTIIMSAQQAKKKQMEAEAKRKAAPAMGKTAPAQRQKRELFPEEEKSAIDRVPQGKPYRSSEVEGRSVQKDETSSPIQVIESKKKAIHISMKSRSEAEKAFIYSEIFNRKY